MIKRVRITNYKSLADVSVDLDPVTVLIGRSGSGKSNFVEALRWLRDLLIWRDEDALESRCGNWNRILSATERSPMPMGFDLDFNAPKIDGEFAYMLRFQQWDEDQCPELAEERLCLNGKVLFHQKRREWIQPPPLADPPDPGRVMLGGLTGVQEATVAHLVLTDGIGCYSFPDSVLTQGNGQQVSAATGLVDNGGNFLQTVVAISVNLQTWQSLRDMAAALRGLKPTLKSIDLQLPGRGLVVVTHKQNDRLLVFDLAQESEGFRRLFACLLALYQTPPKQTLIFDEPEKGIYPAGLAILADEFKGHVERGLGQVILTTHSPQFLDHFAPEQIRVVEMRDYTTRIGPVSPEQSDALREHFIRPGELLTVDEARVTDSLAEVG